MDKPLAVNGIIINHHARLEQVYSVYRSCVTWHHKVCKALWKVDLFVNYLCVYYVLLVPIERHIKRYGVCFWGILKVQNTVIVRFYAKLNVFACLVWLRELVVCYLGDISRKGLFCYWLRIQAFYFHIKSVQAA